ELATWTQAAQLATAGMEVGAHTLSHPFLDRLASAEQIREIAGSVQLIAERLGVRVEGLAYPGGAFNPDSVGAAQGCGLRYAVTTLAGDNGPRSLRFELQRGGVGAG